MDINTIHYIKSNPLVYQYLRANSSWYQRLNRDPDSIHELEKEARAYYKLTVTDRIEKFRHSIDMLSTFMDVLK